jgi:hypothetical protein
VGERLVPQGQPLGPANAQASDESALSRVLRQQQLPEEAVESEEQPSLTDAFAGFSFEETESAAGPRSDAVDLTTFEPEREVREPPPPAHPARHWVQVATGRNASAFRFDWQRLVRNSQGLLEGRNAYRASWNRTNRLLTGPFDSLDDAQSFVRELSEVGISAFRFSSSEGEQIIPVN